MGETFVLRCPFETIFGSISTRSSDPVNVGTAGYQADDLSLLLCFR